MNKLITKAVLALTLFGFVLEAGFAQTTYQTPPQSIADLFNAPPTPSVTFNKDGSIMMILERAGSPTIEDLAQPELRIAGIRINPAISGPSRASSFHNIKIKKTRSGEEIQIKDLPSNPKMSGFSLSQDEKYLAFTQTEASGISLWIVDLTSFEAKKLTDPIINQVFGNSIVWMPDNSILVKVVNPARGSMSKAPAAPVGPIIQETSGNAAPTRTYQDLLTNPYDEALFAYFMDSQLMKISIDGSKTAIGKPGLIKSMDISPDGNFILVETIQKPFSYLVPGDRFPYNVEIWKSNGE
ncbi:MAG TPA: hypothetical protein VLA71_17005, partial [Algoriphagus sp.]|nr:hypothetical protein [Algoriphagus sp.]